MHCTWALNAVTAASTPSPSAPRTLTPLVLLNGLTYGEMYGCCMLGAAGVVQVEVLCEATWGSGMLLLSTAGAADALACYLCSSAGTPPLQLPVLPAYNIPGTGDSGPATTDTHSLQPQTAGTGAARPCALTTKHY
jgi:hypothetical protein